MDKKTVGILLVVVGCGMVVVFPFIHGSWCTVAMLFTNVDITTLLSSRCSFAPAIMIEEHIVTNHTLAYSLAVIACINNTPEPFLSLIKTTTIPCVSDQYPGTTLLHICASGGCLSCCASLVDHHICAVDSTDSFGRSPFLVASTSDIASFLFPSIE